MAITLSTFGNFVSGTTGVVTKGSVVVDTTAAQTVTLPAGVAPGFQLTVVRNGANDITLAAPSGETIDGDTSVSTDHDGAIVVKISATVWSALYIGVSAADIL